MQRTWVQSLAPQKEKGKRKAAAPLQPGLVLHVSRPGQDLGLHPVSGKGSAQWGAGERREQSPPRTPCCPQKPRSPAIPTRRLAFQKGLQDPHTCAHAPHALWHLPTRPVLPPLPTSSGCTAAPQPVAHPSRDQMTASRYEHVGLTLLQKMIFHCSTLPSTGAPSTKGTKCKRL